ncbi:MAG TPA: CheR family methyltransferase [Actinocrinis sp.]|nr:CheR family methyltransferase [Actinocrinis sp.]
MTAETDTDAHTDSGAADTAAPDADQPDGDLEDLLAFLRDARGFDFTGYKRSSLARRIRKRMTDAGVPDFAGYRDRLETDADEFRALFNTILINVTSVFRDTEAWTYLQREVLPDLLAATGPEQEIRVWSAGCSTGEEPYSLAILFAEVLGIAECVKRVKIYATDIDEDALRDARTGSYPARSLEPLSAELRERYFDAAGGQYALRPDLRRRVIFGRHDITRDAPISRLDLLVCRNTLMYFNVEAQKQIVDRFHFALREGGHLFLGKAEMLLSDSERFEVASMRQRVFRRRPGESGAPPCPPPPRLEAYSGREAREVGRRRLLRDLTLEAAPNAVVAVGTDGCVAVFNAQAQTMFGLAAPDLNRPFRDLEISYRPIELRSLMEQAVAERRGIRVAGVERGRPDGEVQHLDILVQPLNATDGLAVGVALTFVDTTVATRLATEVNRIRVDLETAYEALQSTNEELETTNEELQSSIEELETTNEELQSTNEELETTNEELESGNEELETMNEEMRIRSGELDEARGFLAGVLASIAAGVVVLDSQLTVRSWSRGAEELWGLRAAEVAHQPFFALDFGLPIGELHEAVHLCLTGRKRSGPVRMEAVNRIGRGIVCSVTCSPMEGYGEGVVLLMEEVR